MRACETCWLLEVPWLFKSQQSSKLRLSREDELTAEREANSSERKRRNKSVTTPSCGMFLSVSVTKGGGVLLSKSCCFSLPIVTELLNCTHKLITKRISPPFGHEQCCYSFCHRQYFCAGGIW